jgi:hypothetical protein
MATGLAGASSSASRPAVGVPGGLAMNDVMHILSAIKRCDPNGADKLLPLVSS